MHTLVIHLETEVLTRAQAAELLGVTPETLARSLQQGRGPAYSLTGVTKGRALYSAASITEWAGVSPQDGQPLT